MEPLLEHIAKFANLDESAAAQISSGFSVLLARKKEHLQQQGDRPALFFVGKGCLRLYLVNEKGNEQTLQFAIENWWIGDFLGFYNDGKSGYFVQAVENSEVFAIGKNDFDALLAEVPQLERYFRHCFQKTAGAAQMRIRYLFTMSAEERYHKMNDNFPWFMQRVPQYMIASYLDVSAEFLSKIRSGKL